MNKTLATLSSLTEQWPNGDKTMRVAFLDNFGIMTSVDKLKNPYSYKSFLMWGNKVKGQIYITDYSDRLYQRDATKYNKCCQSVFGNHGQYFDKRDPKLVEKFLNLYYGNKTKLCWIEESCNASNGYPLWLFGCQDK